MEQHTHITEMVERFLDGMTSNEEEQQLYAFFAGEDVPESLEAYKEMFAWFDGGLTQEIQKEKTAVTVPMRPKHRFHIWGTIAAVAATVALILLIRTTSEKHGFNQFEGSYIVRNGVVITDPEQIRDELEATLEYVCEEEQELLENLYLAYEDEIQDLREEQKRREELMNYINSFPEGEVRDEVISMLLTK